MVETLLRLPRQKIRKPRRKLVIYVGCALTHATEEAKREVELTKEKMRQRMPYANVLDFFGLIPAASPYMVYRFDIQGRVARCDLFVVIVNDPSLGSGLEIGAALYKYKKFVLAVAHGDAKVSRLILGITDPHFKFSCYNGRMSDDVPAMVDAEIEVRSRLRAIRDRYLSKR